MKKIDFHIHTKPDASKDNKFEFSMDWLKAYIKQSNLDAISITNHNLFDINQFNEIDTEIQCAVFPGMELSLENFHVQVIYNNDDPHKNELDQASKKLKELGLGSRKGISIKKFKEIFKSWRDSILIFEYGKSNSVRSIPSELSCALCLVGVSNPRKFYRVYNQENLTPVLFSDAHATKDNSDSIRNNINKLKIKQTFIECDSSRYVDIYNALRDKNAVELNRDKLKDSFNIEIYNSEKKSEGKVRVSTGLNLIIGSRGSGKTYFLNSIKESVEDSELFEIGQFQSSRKAEEILKNKKSEQINNEFKSWKGNYEKEWQYIYNYAIKKDDILLEKEFTKQVGDYLRSLREYRKCENKKSSANKLNLFKQNNLPSNELVNMLCDKLKSIKDLIKSNELWEYMKNHVNKQFSNADIIDTQEKIKKLIVFLEKELRKDKLNEEIKKEANKIVQSAKVIIANQTGVPNVPVINMSDLYRRYYLTKRANEFLKKIVQERELNTTNIDEYKIKVKVLPYLSVTEFKNAHTRNGRSIGSFADKFNKLYKRKCYIQFLRVYKNLVGNGNIQREDLERIFVNVKAYLLTADNIPASGGQKVGFSLMLALEEAKNKQYIVIDEPEASLDNKFIKDNLISKLQALSKGSTVFVVTHNSTLGTLLNPNYLIVAKREGGNYSYLSGDFKQNKISNKNKEISSDEDFINAMEAGIDTYYEKGRIYENLRNHQ